LKPGAKLYAYFNNIEVTGWCRKYGTNVGDPLLVNDDGSIEGLFTIPPNKFQATELTFMLCDVDNLVTGANAITTQGTGTYYASKLSVTKGRTILNTREPILSSHEVTQTQQLTTTNADYKAITEIEPGPPITPVVIIINPKEVIKPVVTPPVSDTVITDPRPYVGGWVDNNTGGDGWDGIDDCECENEEDDDDDDDDE
jgi:hypothetical protein